MADMLQWIVARAWEHACAMDFWNCAGVKLRQRYELEITELGLGDWVSSRCSDLIEVQERSVRANAIHGRLSLPAIQGAARWGQRARPSSVGVSIPILLSVTFVASCEMNRVHRCSSVVTSISPLLSPHGDFGALEAAGERVAEQKLGFLCPLSLFQLHAILRRSIHAAAFAVRLCEDQFELSPHAC
jgi:hypothetical protein